MLQQDYFMHPQTMASTAPTCTPFDIVPGDQRASQSRNSRWYAILFAFLLGMMVSLIGLLTVQRYGLGNTSFTTFFFAPVVPRVQPASSAAGTSTGAQVSVSEGHHWGSASPASIHPPIPPTRSQQMSVSLPDLFISPVLSIEASSVMAEPPLTDEPDGSGTNNNADAPSAQPQSSAWLLSTLSSVAPFSLMIVIAGLIFQQRQQSSSMGSMGRSVPMGMMSPILRTFHCSRASLSTARMAAELAAVLPGSPAPGLAARAARPQMLSSDIILSGPEDDNRRKRRQSVAAILMASFLNLLGFTMAGPITPALGKHFSLDVGASFGSLTSAYPFGVLFGLFLWPRLSDSIGRKPIMTISLLGTGLGLVLQSLAIRTTSPLGVFLALRVLTGAFAGSSPVSKAYLADVAYKDEKLPRYLALRDAASTMAFIVGPVLGGIMYDIRARTIAKAELMTRAASLSFTIGISAAASLLAAVLIGTFVQEVPRTKTQESVSNNTIDQPKENFISCPLGQRKWAGVATVCVITFLFNIGDSTFHAFFAALLRDGAGMHTKDIGLLYTGLACISFSVSTTVTSRLLKSWGPVVACAMGLGCVGSGLLAFGVAAWPGMLAVQPRLSVLGAAAAIYYCGVPLYGPSIPMMLLRCVPSSQRGLIMGLDGTINTVARIISPLMMGEICRRFGAGVAFGLAGAVVFFGLGTTLFRRFVVLRDS